MRPRAIAVVGASRVGGQDRQLGHEEPRQRRLRGRDLPGQPEGDEILGKKVYADISDLPDDVDVAVFAIPAKFVVDTIAKVGDKGIATAILIPSGFAETGEDELQHAARRHRARARRPLRRPEHLRRLLHAAEHERGVHDALRREGPGGAGVAERRHRHGDPRLQPLDQAGRVGDRRPRQQGRHRRGRPADVLRAGRRHATASRCTWRTSRTGARSSRSPGASRRRSRSSC